MQHHRHVSVTYFNRAELLRARTEAKRLGFQVSDVFDSEVNAYGTFFTIPCGSKVGWGEYEKETAAIDALLAWLAGTGNGYTWICAEVGELGVQTRSSEDVELAENAMRGGR